MANTYIRSIEVRRAGRTWGVYVNGTLVEGGFFARGAAEAMIDWWQRNYREETPDQPCNCEACQHGDGH
jgi:hypothetical protein